MSQKKYSELIKELEYAKQLHSDELKERIKEQKQTLKDKDLVIKTLENIESGKQVQEKTIKQAIHLVAEWRDSHYLWIDLVRQNKKWASYGGNITWQKKWIKIYDEMLTILKRAGQ